MFSPKSFSQTPDIGTQLIPANTTPSEHHFTAKEVAEEWNLSQDTIYRLWRQSEQALRFQNIFAPPVIRMDYQLPDLENPTRNHGVTLGQVAARATDAPELRKASLVMRAQSYRRRMFAEFDNAKELLLP